MFWAENLKRRFMEKMADKKEDAEHQPDVGAGRGEESEGGCHNGSTEYSVLFKI